MIHAGDVAPLLDHRAQSFQLRINGFGSFLQGKFIDTANEGKLGYFSRSSWGVEPAITSRG